MVHLAAPGAIGTLLSPSAETSNSTTHRLGDFEDVTPDVYAHPLFGRGFGTLDEEEPKVFRINDDEYLDELWEVGIVGLIAYIFMILAPIILARRGIRGDDPEISSLALAGSAGCVAYLVVNVLFDAMSFPQAPYMFFMVAAITTIAAAGPAGNVGSARARVRCAGARRDRGRAAAAKEAAIGQGAATTSSRPLEGDRSASAPRSHRPQ